MNGPFSLPGDVEVIAHRGFSAAAPENTVVALRAGLDAGADAVEFDLHTAADGTPVLLHDETLRRTTDGRGRVTDRTAEELGVLDAGSWFDSAFAGEPVPTLAAALQAVKTHGASGAVTARIYAEVKGVRDVADLDAVVGAVLDADLGRRTVYISMTWDYLHRIREIEPEALLGYIVERRRRADEAIGLAADDANALLDFDARILLSDPSLARKAIAKGIPLACWTVDSPHDAEALVGMGVPRITTNRVARMVRWRKERSAI